MKTSAIIPKKNENFVELRNYYSSSAYQQMPRYLFRYTENVLDPSEPFPRGLIVRRPLLVVKLVAATGISHDCLVCPDTGSDHCVFPLSFARIMGLDPATLKSNRAIGVGNDANVMHYELITIKMDFGLGFEAYVGFTDGLDEIGYGLLGQVGFFDKYTVLFDYSASEFCIYTRT
jgi:hypothetical protein